MNKGSVYKAKEQMKWAGLILLIIPFTTHIILSHKIVSNEDYWILITIGIICTFVLYYYVVMQIWKKIRERYIKLIIDKILNYYLMCLASISKEDYKRVEFILNKCLEKYDSSSIFIYYIKGAYTIGTKDFISLKLFEKELKDFKRF
jgi:hypothetical protein